MPSFSKLFKQMLETRFRCLKWKRVLIDCYCMGRRMIKVKPLSITQSCVKLRGDLLDAHVW